MPGNFLKPTTPLDRKTLGKYELLSRLSTGGMSEIFLATQTGLAGFRKIVVLKSILPNIRGEEEFVRMFLEEARITSSFNHPNIAQVFDLDTDDEHLFLAMEFVQGATLNEVTRACEQRAVGLPLGFALTAVRDSALALHYAHTFSDSRGRKQTVIHRDVSGKNIMVTYEGTTKLLDFGIAKSLGAYRSDTTSTGMVKGTTGYMSPEQVLGEPLDPRSDIFSLGIVLHEALTGARLFARPTEEQEMRAVINEAAQPPSRLNPAVSYAIDKVTLKALSPRREQRYGTALEFARALETAAAGTLWHPEQLGELVQKLHAERLQQTHSLVQQAQGSTGENTGLQLRHGPTSAEETTGVVAVASQVTTQQHPAVPPAPPPSPPTAPMRQERGVTLETPAAALPPFTELDSVATPEEKTSPDLPTTARPPARVRSNPGSRSPVPPAVEEPRASAPTQSLRGHSTPGVTLPVEPPANGASTSEPTLSLRSRSNLPPVETPSAGTTAPQVAQPAPLGRSRTNLPPVETLGVKSAPAFRPDGDLHDPGPPVVGAAPSDIHPLFSDLDLEKKTSPSIQLPLSAAIRDEPPPPEPKPVPRRGAGRVVLLGSLLVLAAGGGLFWKFRPDLRLREAPPAVAPPVEPPAPVVEAPPAAPPEPPAPAAVEAPVVAPPPVVAPAPAPPPAEPVKHGKGKATKTSKKKKKGVK